MPNKLYDILKWVGLICLPALASAYAAIGALWGWPNVTAVVGTITTLGALVGALIGISAYSRRTEEMADELVAEQDARNRANDIETANFLDNLAILDKQAKAAADDARRQSDILNGK